MMSKYEEFCCRQDFLIPKTMQALVASGKGFDNLEVKQVLVPETGPEQLLARVDAAGEKVSIIMLTCVFSKLQRINNENAIC